MFSCANLGLMNKNGIAQYCVGSYDKQQISAAKLQCKVNVSDLASIGSADRPYIVLQIWWTRAMKFIHAVYNCAVSWFDCQDNRRLDQGSSAGYTPTQKATSLVPPIQTRYQLSSELNLTFLGIAMVLEPRSEENWWIRQIVEWRSILCHGDLVCRVRKIMIS